MIQNIEHLLKVYIKNKLKLSNLKNKTQNYREKYESSNSKLEKRKMSYMKLINKMTCEDQKHQVLAQFLKKKKPIIH